MYQKDRLMTVQEIVAEYEKLPPEGKRFVREALNEMIANAKTVENPESRPFEPNADAEDPPQG